MISMFDAYQDSYGLDWAYVVSCNLFGARDKFDTEFGHVVPSLIKKFHDVKMGHSDRVVVWGDGSAQRDFMYVKDTARVCVEVMTHLEGTVNIGSGRVYSIRDIVDKLGGIFDLHGSIDWDETKPNGQDFRSYELSKINSIGFRCKYSIDAGLEETVEWYASQQNSI
jgi:GDP-L-fucose synthase